MGEKLKPCPFCGSPAILQTLSNEYHGMCSNPECYSCGAFSTSRKKAIDAWNTRQEENNEVSRL